MDHHDQLYRALRGLIITLAIAAIVLMLSDRLNTLTGAWQVWAAVIILVATAAAVGWLAYDVFRWARQAVQNRRNNH